MANSRKKSYILNKNIRKSRRVKRKYHLQKGGEANNQGKVIITLPTTVPAADAAATVPAADAAAAAAAATVPAADAAATVPAADAAVSAAKVTLKLNTTTAAAVIPYVGNGNIVEFPFNIASSLEFNNNLMMVSDNKADVVITDNIKFYYNAKPLHEAFSIFVEDFSINRTGSRIFEMHNSLKMLHIPSLKFREYVYFDLAEIGKIRATATVPYSNIDEFIELKTTITSKVIGLPTGKSILPVKNEGGVEESEAVSKVTTANKNITFSEENKKFVPEELIPLFNDNHKHNTIRNNKDLLISYIDIIAEIDGLFQKVILPDYKDNTSLKNFIDDTLKDSNIEPMAHIFNKRGSLKKVEPALRKRLQGEYIGKFTFLLK